MSFEIAAPHGTKVRTFVPGPAPRPFAPSRAGPDGPPAGRQPTPAAGRFSADRTAPELAPETIPVEACRRLWLAVLSECCKSVLVERLRDYRGERRPGCQTWRGRLLPVASGWIGSADFLMVCDFAGLDGPGMAAGLGRVMRSEAGIAALLADWKHINSGRARI